MDISHFSFITFALYHFWIFLELSFLYNLPFTTLCSWDCLRWSVEVLCVRSCYVTGVIVKREEDLYSQSVNCWSRIYSSSFLLLDLPNSLISGESKFLHCFFILTWSAVHKKNQNLKSGGQNCGLANSVVPYNPGILYWSADSWVF